MDVLTLTQLLREASEKYEEAKAEFEDTDSCDAMHEMSEWLGTVHWLQSKLDKETK